MIVNAIEVLVSAGSKQRVTPAMNFQGESYISFSLATDTTARQEQYFQQKINVLITG